MKILTAIIIFISQQGVAQAQQITICGTAVPQSQVRIIYSNPEVSSQMFNHVLNSIANAKSSKSCYLDDGSFAVVLTDKENKVEVRIVRSNAG